MSFQRSAVQPVPAPGPGGVTFVEIEGHVFTLLQATEIIAAIAKGGKTLTLRSYDGNEVAKIVLFDTAINVIGPVTFTGNVIFFGAKTSFSVITARGITVAPAGFEQIEALGVVAYLTESAECSFARVNPRHAGGSSVGGILKPELGTELQDGHLLRLLNEGPEPVTFLHQAVEVETEPAVKTPVAEANRLILSEGKAIKLAVNGIADFIYDATLKRWHGWQVSV